MPTLFQMVKATPAIVRLNSTLVGAKITKATVDERNTQHSLEFKARSKGGPLYDVKIILTGPSYSDFSDLVRKADAWVHCNCNYFKYNCEVALSRLNASDIIESDGSAPKVTNPKMLPMVCKHIIGCIARIKNAEYKKVKPHLMDEFETKLLF